MIYQRCGVGFLIHDTEFFQLVDYAPVLAHWYMDEEVRAPSPTGLRNSIGPSRVPSSFFKTSSPNMSEFQAMVPGRQDGDSKAFAHRYLVQLVAGD